MPEEECDLLVVVAVVGTGLERDSRCSSSQLLVEVCKERETSRGRSAAMAYEWQSGGREWGNFAETLAVPSLWARFQTGNWSMEALPQSSRMFPLFARSLVISRA
jgi:hypothetical protein